MEHKKPKLNRQTLLEDARFFGLLNLGLILTALGIVLFKSPNQFAFGGTSGLSVILATLFPRWNVGAFMWVINIALVVLGFCLAEKRRAYYIMAAVLLLLTLGHVLACKQ